MHEQAADQEWKQLETHIKFFVGQALSSDGQRIEYQPRFMAKRLEIPSRNQNDPVVTSAKDEYFGQKGGSHE